jgi:hypothetical protein
MEEILILYTITRKVAIKKLHNMHYESFPDITDLLIG